MKINSNKIIIYKLATKYKELKYIMLKNINNKI